jgi:uncharacterized protein (TIGR01777 family)
MERVKQRRIVLAGGSGQVGSVLARHFHSLGDSVVVLSRKSVQSPWRTVQWDGATLGQWVQELNNAHVVINLAGRSVNCRYNAAHRREILESRIKSTQILGAAIRQLADPPRLWMNASTATIYRHAFDRPMDEFTGEIDIVQPNAPPSWNFSIEVATRWEEAFFDSENPGTRKIALRSAMTMSPDRGGIFDVLLGLVRLGLGGTCGSGRQFVSWIHETDSVRAIEFLIAHGEMTGTVNISSPNPLPNREFMRAIRDAWRARIGLPATEWMLELGAVLLRTETELVLKSRRVVPCRLLNAGFLFRFPEWPEAAKDLVEQWRETRRISGPVVGTKRSEEEKLSCAR